MTLSAVVAAVGLLSSTGCMGRLSTRPGVFDVTRKEVAFAGKTLDATYVKPASDRGPQSLVVFFTGDAGWLGACGEIFEHLAESGHTMVGFNSREALRPIKKSGKKVATTDMASALAEVLTQAKQDLNLPESTPVIVVGDSRGASVVAFAAVHPKAQQGVQGGIAIALTRESDYLRVAKREGAPVFEVDKEGRILLYPALEKRGPFPLAVIQSTGDKYVPADEARTLLGPDSPTLRFYPVEAKNHGFSGGREELLKDLDDALAWIETSEAPTGPAQAKE